METDKENVRRTRIPLPKEPLPALPKHLLTDSKKLQKQGNIPNRIPLKILNSQVWPRAGPSKAPYKPKFFMHVDTRHVTLRQRSEDLDWNYKVFRDDEAEKDSSVLSISDDEMYLGKENQRYFGQKNKKSDLGNMLSTLTPNFDATLENSRVKNIKRSLKRPHSRELQGLSPVVKQDKLDDKAKRRLRYECLQDRLDSPDFWKSSYLRCLNRDYTEDIFNYLLAVETKPLDIPRTSSITRACVINWLMKINGANGNPSTVQSTCWYLDSILGTGHVQLDKLQLVAAACFWIAQKIHGPVAPAAKLVKCANMAFTPEKLLNAEKIVLLRLRFPKQPIVVQDYITYLAWFCDQHHGGEIEVAATFLCMSGLMVDKTLCDEYPSVIAAAAVRSALVLLAKKDLIARLQTCPVYMAAEKKAKKISSTCSMLCRAVRTVSAPAYEYKSPLEHYGGAPNFIAQRIVTAANNLVLFERRNTHRSNSEN